MLISYTYKLDPSRNQSAAMEKHVEMLKTQEPIPAIYEIELLKVLIADNALRQRDLVSIFKTESIVSAILKNRRKLTTRHI